MKKNRTISRRTMMSTMAGLAGVTLLPETQATAQVPSTGATGGRIKQSVSRWCYDKTPLDQLCVKAKEIGLKGLDLIDEQDWEIVIAHGLEVAMPNGPGGITKGWNDPKNHSELIKRSNEMLPKLASLGIKNMIVFSGNRGEIDNEEGLKYCAMGLKQLLPEAEKLNITLIMELLNSKRDHKKYMADHTVWGANLAEKLGSEKFKLLYDVYHMQIMEGDIIETIRTFGKYIGHYHTGGVPGRNEINGTQEINYRRVCEVIAESGFQGFLAHEFIPQGDPMASLREAFDICNV